jgi:predicted kinase
MLKTRRREARLLSACLEAKQRFVVDNTNPTAEDRRRYIDPAKAAGFRVVGYYFPMRLEEALRRNAAREGSEKIPAPGVRRAFARLEVPSLDEGFDAIYSVRIGEGGGFVVQENPTPV